MRPLDRKGVALLETIIALAILAVTAVTLTGAVGASVRTEAEAATREYASTRMDEFLAGLSLMTREELEGRRGIREMGLYEVEIVRLDPWLYRIEVRGPGEGRGPGLMTLLARPPEVTR